MNIQGLVLPYPVSANRYWATRVIKVGKRWMAVTYVTAAAKKYREDVRKALLAYGVREPLEGRVIVGLRLYPHRPLDWKTRLRKYGPQWDDTVRCIDLGNTEKVVSDAMQGVAIKDDAQHRKIVLERMEPDDGGARLVLWVESIAPLVFEQPMLASQAPAPQQLELVP